MYDAKKAVEKTGQIEAVLKAHFGSVSEVSLASAAVDLHDIAWECQKILENVEKIRGGGLKRDEIFALIVDVLTGIQSHINSVHLPSLKDFVDEIDSD